MSVDIVQSFHSFCRVCRGDGHAPEDVLETVACGITFKNRNDGQIHTYCGLGSLFTSWSAPTEVSQIIASLQKRVSVLCAGSCVLGDEAGLSPVIHQLCEIGILICLIHIGNGHVCEILIQHQNTGSGGGSQLIILKSIST